MFTLTVASLARAVICDDICAATNQNVVHTFFSDRNKKIVIIFSLTE